MNVNVTVSNFQEGYMMSKKWLSSLYDEIVNMFCELETETENYKKDIDRDINEILNRINTFVVKNKGVEHKKLARHILQKLILNTPSVFLSVVSRCHGSKIPLTKTGTSAMHFQEKVSISTHVLAYVFVIHGRKKARYLFDSYLNSTAFDKSFFFDMTDQLLLGHIDIDSFIKNFEEVIDIHSN